MDQEATKSIREIYDENGGDLNRVADILDISVSALMAKMAPIPAAVHRRRQPPVDLGNPNLRKHMVSARYADHPTWPSDDQNKIDAARAKYEAGTHEICQGRDRDWFTLYCIPRVVRVGARKFFRTFE